MKIDKEILKIIESGRVKDNLYFLPSRQLDRQTYLSVNKVLTCLGGHWDRSQKAHVFEQPIDDAIENVILFGEVVDKKRELQFFETPPQIAEQCCELACLTSDSVVLEPSAGKGSILKTIGDYCNAQHIYWAEIDKNNIGVLRSLNIGEQIGEDFLSIEPNGHYVNRVIMNPPFSKQQDIDHVSHALSFMHTGILISIMSPGIQFRTNKKTTSFMEEISQYDYEIIELPKQSFQKSGTMVNTIILKVSK